MTPLQLGLSARDRRTLASGTVTIVLLFALARGLPAALSWQRDRVAESAALTLGARNARAALRDLPTIRDSLRARAARLAAFDTVMLSGESAAAAAANLASLLESLADSSSLKVNAMGLRPDSAAVGALAPVAVRVTGTTDVTGLASFLSGVEGNRAPMLVRELAVTQPDPTAATGKVEQLRVDILVEAMARIGGSRWRPTRNHP